MVRTKADSSSVKAAGAKAPRKGITPTSSTSSASGDSSGKSSYGGGNNYHPRETPGWQKPITSFFARPQRKPEEENAS